MVRTFALGLGSVLLIKSMPVHAAMTGTLALRGVVTAQALVRLAAPSTAMALSFGSTLGGGNVATVRLSALANSPGGFTVSLGTSTEGGGATLLAEDGSSVAYQVRYGGKTVDLSQGETELAAITPHTSEGDDKDLQIETPDSLNGTSKRFTDHLILTVKAR